MTSAKPQDAPSGWHPVSLSVSAAGQRQPVSKLQLRGNQPVVRWVAELDRLLTQLRSEGCKVLDKTETSEYGKLGWAMDPEGNKIELWQPPKGQ